MRRLLHAAADRAANYLESQSERPVGGRSARDEIFAALDRPCPESATPAECVLTELARDVDTGLVASGTPRYFGFVIGGATPASIAADWLTSAWDQNAQVYATSPAAAVVEEIVERWLLELLELPRECSVGFTTGCQMANFTALSAARNAVLATAGWDLDANGLFGAPPIAVFLSEQAHATVRAALRLAGIGASQIHEVPADSQGRMRIEALAQSLKSAHGQPVIISTQAGNVNTGAFEAFDAIADLARTENAWLHVDGAFGLWAAVSPKLRPMLSGFERADSWATDAHKWLSVPYDSGIVIVRDPRNHRRLKAARCAYAGTESDERRDGSTWAPENSRRARAFVLYAGLRALGRSGIREMVERCCDCAAQFASEAALLPHARVLNDVVLNQVLIRFEPPNSGDLDAFHDTLAAAIQKDGRCWLGATRWQGKGTLRVSVSNWLTRAEDVTESVQAIAASLRRLLS